MRSKVRAYSRTVRAQIFVLELMLGEHARRTFGIFEEQFMLVPNPSLDPVPGF